MPEDKKNSGLNKDISSIFAGLEEVGNGRGTKPEEKPEEVARPENNQPAPETTAPEPIIQSEDPGEESAQELLLEGELFIAGSFPARRQALIGLDIGRSGIRLVQVYPVPGGWEIGGVAFKEIRLDPDEEGLEVEDRLAGALKELLNEAKIRSRTFASSLRGEGINTCLIPLARMPKKELEGASRLEVKRRVAFDVEKAAIHNSLAEDPGGRPGAKLNYLVTATRREAVQRRMAITQSLGILVKALVPMPFAWKGVLGILPETSEAVMVVDIGSVKTTINIFKEDRLKFSREVSGGGDGVTSEIIQAGRTFGEPTQIEWEEAEEIKRKNNLITGLGGGVLRSVLTIPQAGSMVRPVLERIVQECRRSLEYYDQLFRDGKVSRIYLTGGGALLPGFYSFFQERLTTPTELLLPPENLHLHPSIRDGEGVFNRFPILARAASLALLQKPDINLIPPVALFIQSILRSKVAIVGFALFLFIVSFLFHNSKAALIPEVQRQIAGQERQVERLTEQLAPYSELETLKRKESGMAKLTTYSREPQPDWKGILKELSLITPPEVVLKRITLQSSEEGPGQELLIEGNVLHSEGTLAAPVTDFVVLMEKSPFFRDVEAIKESGREGTFSFKCSLAY